MEIPSVINNVTVEFGDGVVNDVVVGMVRGLEHCISPTVAAGASLRGAFLLKIYISSVKDHHDGKDQKNSRHNQKRAVDISRINGTKIAVGYTKDESIKAIVDGIQTMFETFSLRRENFGPLFKHKLGKDHAVGGHQDHIHLSVN